MEFKIDKGIAVPEFKRGGLMNEPSYPVGDLEIGDSFAVVCEGKKGPSWITHYRKKFHKRKFTVRLVNKEKNEYRIWRVS